MAAKAKPKKRAQNKVKQGLKPTPQEKIAQSLLNADPTMTKCQISNELTDMGIYRHPQSAYRMLTKSRYLRADLDAVRQSNREFLSRKIVPKALKLHAEALNDKSLDIKDKLPWVKLAHDKEFAEDAPKPMAETINIEQIQVLIADTLGVNKGK